MSFNPVENLFLAYGMSLLGKQYRRIHPEYRGRFGLETGETLMLLHDGRLTIAQQSAKDPKECKPDSRFTAVDCYNILYPDLDFPTNVEYLGEWMDSRYQKRMSFHEYVAARLNGQETAVVGRRAAKRAA